MAWLDTILRWFPALARTRQHHALEHATLHLLAKRFPQQALAGHSDPAGFWILGAVPTEAVEQAVAEALTRLQQGEHHLALHPGCGTNYLALGSLAAAAGLVGFAGTRRWRERWERFPLVVFLSMLALIFGRPLGFWLQREVTTDPRVDDVEIVAVEAARRGRFPAHRVTTRRVPPTTP